MTVEETLDEIIDALSKQIAKKVIDEGTTCPNCGASVINEADNDYLFDYCYHCGQKLDWE